VRPIDWTRVTYDKYRRPIWHPYRWQARWQWAPGIYITGPMTRTKWGAKRSLETYWKFGTTDRKQRDKRVWSPEL
jgi:hypothetical protein